MLIRPNTSGWGGYPGRQSAPVTIALSTPELATAALLGSGSLTVDRMRAPRVTLTAEGAGRLAVHTIEADNASLAIAGSGAIDAAGRAKLAVAVARGAAEIHAPDLQVADLTLTSETAGTVSMQATRSAKVTALGIGAVEVAGPAGCEVKKVGGGPLRCGKN